jgi:hypothetical protein
MAAIPGTILAAKISPGDTAATFATHEDIYGQGGLKTVTTLDDLTGIPLARQKTGMIVYVADNNTYYSLSSLSYPLTSFTTNFSFGSGGGGSGTVTGDYLPLSGGTITGGLTITNNLSTSVFITDLSTTKTFLSSDTCRVFHFDTTTQPLCAVFPNALPNGFNVAIMNTGTNTLRVSAAQLNSVGVIIGVQYGGAFVYKDNNQLFAVGRL